MITFHRKILVTGIPNRRLLYYTAGVQCFSSGKHLNALSSAFSNQAVGEVSGHQKTATSHSLQKNAFSEAKIYTKKTEKKFQTLACNAYQNCPIFRLQKLVRN